MDYGKVLKIDLNTKASEVFTKGHRNPQGVKVDREGRVWSVEHGPQGGDELNLLLAGENYGWPNVTLGINYNNRPWPLNASQGRHQGYRLPTYSWISKIAPSNIDQSINFHPFWEGDLLVFSLAGKSIFRIREARERVVAIERIQFSERIRYGLNHAPAGRIYLWTDAGNLYELQPDQSAWALLEQSREQYRGRNPQALSRAEAILYECMECHQSGISAPVLNRLVGRKIGGTPYAGYSDALKRVEGNWDRASLISYLKQPQLFAPGTTMPNPHISSEEFLNEIVGELIKLD